MSGTLHPTYGALPWHATGANVYTRSGEPIAEVDFNLGSGDGAKIAALIAAAPILVDVLRDVLVEYEGAAIFTSKELIARLRAAIAAAGAA